MYSSNILSHNWGRLPVEIWISRCGLTVAAPGAGLRMGLAHNRKLGSVSLIWEWQNLQGRNIPSGLESSYLVLYSNIEVYTAKTAYLLIGEVESRLRE